MRSTPTWLACLALALTPACSSPASETTDGGTRDGATTDDT